MNPPKKVMLLTLKTFSLTGGIEKVCRSLAYSLQKMHEEQVLTFQMVALYDDLPDERYISPVLFEGCQKHPKWGMFKALQKGLKQDILILSHINLAPIGLLVKILSPTTRVILWTHGIEVWRPISWIKKIFLKKVNQIVAVSQHTANNLKQWHQVDLKKVKVIHNALDPFFKIPNLVVINGDAIRRKYQISLEATLFTAVCRLRNSEQAKNYDLVIEAIAQLKAKGFSACYLLCGAYNDQEFERINLLKKRYELNNEVILTGFLNDDELTNHLTAADAFVLPSQKEGFGIVYIEAQACGLNIIIGNEDGSQETLAFLEAGKAISINLENVVEAMKSICENTTHLQDKIQIQQATIAKFGHNLWYENIKALIA